MATLVNSYSSSNSDDFNNALTPATSVTASAGDLIVISMFFTEASASVWTAPTWNGQTFTQLDTTKFSFNEQIFYLTVVTGGTANVVSTSTEYHYITDLIGVWTPTAAFASPPVNGYSTVLYTDVTGSYATPTYTGTSVGATDVVVGLLKASLYDNGYSVISTSFAATSPSTDIVSKTFANNGIAQHYMATNTGVGTVAVSFTKTGTGNPLHRMTGFVIRETASVGGTANITGVSSTTSAGTMIATGAGSKTITGVSSTASAGTMTATAGTNISITGVSSTTNAGTVVGTGAANKTITGVSSTTSAGTITAAGATLSISSIDQLVEGTTSTITFSSSFSPTSVTITDGTTSVNVTSFSGSGATRTFTCPALTDGVVGLLLGSVNVTATDGSITTAAFASTYTKTSYVGQVITSLGTGNIGQGFSPALATGNQIAYDSSKGTVGADGIFTGTYTGTQTLWDHNSSDFKWRSFSVVTVNGEYVSTATITGVSSTTSAGTVVAKGAGTTVIVGVASTTSAGTISAAASSSATLTGVSSTTSAGIVTGHGDGTSSITGVVYTTSAGTVTASSVVDLVPNQFYFDNVYSATLATPYPSNEITVTGVTPANNIPISIVGGTYTVNGGLPTASSGNVVLGDIVRIQLTSSASYSTYVSATLTIGTVSAVYGITTTAEGGGGGFQGTVTRNVTSGITP